jgi:hypothetical protein
MRTTVIAILGALTLAIGVGSMTAPAFARSFTTKGEVTIDCGHTSSGWYNPAAGVCQFPGE